MFFIIKESKKILKTIQPLFFLILLLFIVYGFVTKSVSAGCTCAACMNCESTSSCDPNGACRTTCECTDSGGGGGGDAPAQCPAGTALDWSNPSYFCGSAANVSWHRASGCCVLDYPEYCEGPDCPPWEPPTCRTWQIQVGNCVPICDANLWGAWSACSSSCGPGTQSRTNDCGTVETQNCMVNDPDVWGECSLNCGTGSQTNECGTARDCNTQICGPWIKLKNSSFVSPNNLFNMIALTPDAYDSDDTTEQYFIIGAAGIVVATTVNVNISNVELTTKTGNPEYTDAYTPLNSFTPATYLSYVKARKEYKVITSVGEITESGVYVFNGDVSISSSVNPFDQPYKIVLIVSGAVTVSSAPDNTFTPVGSVGIVATTINFSSSITEASGIFIGNTISTGTNATQGLKIIGNLIAQTSLVNNREWPTTARPSVFIKFDQTKYIDLLPYLSTANYQWRQGQ